MQPRLVGSSITPSNGLQTPARNAWLLITKQKKTLCSVFFFRAGKGNDSSSVTRAKARADSSPLRASRYAIIPKQLVRTSCISLFSRPLFSGPRPNYDKKKKTTFVGGLSFLEREKGLGPSTPTLARSCSTN